MRLFHVTTAAALPHIALHGLQPQIGPRSSEAQEPTPATWCFISAAACEDGLSGWLGEQFEEDAALVILEIEVDDQHPAVAEDSSAGFEIGLRSPVPPSALIRVLDESSLAEVVAREQAAHNREKVRAG